MSLKSATYAAFIELFKRLTSRRLWMVIFSAAVMWAALERGVNHLYMLQQWQSAVYGSMFLAVIGVIGAIVGKYIGIKDVSISSVTSVQGAIQAAAQAISEKREEHIIMETIEHVIDEGAPGAPTRRPLSPLPEGEDDGN